jgi:hypothetical protein
MQPLQVPSGATIFRAGDPSQAVYLIEDGEVAAAILQSGLAARLMQARSGSGRQDHPESSLWQGPEDEIAQTG